MSISVPRTPCSPAIRLVLASYLLIDETGVRSAVLVGEIQRIPRKLDAAVCLALDEVGVLLPWSQIVNVVPLFLGIIAV